MSSCRKQIINALVLLLGIFFCLLPFDAASQLGVAAAPLPFSNSHLKIVDGIKIHYRIWPSNQPTNKPWVLMVHGFAGSTYSWETSADYLSRNGFTVIAIDVPPFGFSDKNRKINISTDFRAQLLWKFLLEMNDTVQWTLFGHSMGGAIVQAMAIVNPGRVYKVVFVAPALFYCLKKSKRRLSQRLITFWPVEHTLAIFGNLFLIRPKRIEKLLESAYAQKPSKKDVETYYSALSVRGTALAIIGTSARVKVTNELCVNQFKSDALAIWGEKDTWVPYNRFASLTDTMDSLSVVIIKNHGHNPMETEAELFNRVVLQFLNQ